MIFTIIVNIIALITFCFLVVVAYKWPNKAREMLEIIKLGADCLTWPVVIFIVVLILGPVLMYKIYDSDNLRLQLFSNQLVIGNALEKFEDIKSTLEQSMPYENIDSATSEEDLSSEYSSDDMSSETEIVLDSTSVVDGDVESEYKPQQIQRIIDNIDMIQSQLVETLEKEWHHVKRCCWFKH